MGATKVSTESNTQSTPTPTAEETELNKMELQRQRDINPYITPMQQQAYGLGSKLLQGQELPGYLSSLPQGVQSQQMDVGSTQLGEDYTANLVRQSLRDIYPQFQQMGLPIESGVAQSIAGRTAGDIRRGVAETNIERGMGAQQFNIQTDQNTQYQNLNNLFNLLNLAVGGQAQIQAPVQAGSEALGQRLAGLRTTTERGTGAQRSPFQGANLGIFGTWGSNYCWVASEIFGGWFEPKTILVRYYIGNIAPKWFKNFYIRYGEKIAKFIHDKPVLKYMLKPLFELFVKKSRRVLWE